MAISDKYTVCLFGTNYDVGNQGCRALTASLVRLVVDSHPDAEINLLYGTRAPGTRTIPVAGREVTVNVVNSRMSPKSKLNQHLAWITAMAVAYALLPVKPVRRLITRSTPWLASLERADFVGDIRAGDSFSDIYGMQRLFFGSLPALTALLLGKKLVFLPQTYGPFKAVFARRIARYLFRKSFHIYGRDMDSLDLVREMLGRDASDGAIRFCPDVAFTMDALPPPAVEVEPSLRDGDDTPLIGINVSGLLYNGGYTGANMFGLGFEYKEFVIALVENLLAATGARIMLIPHVFSAGVESDVNACRDIFERCGGGSRNGLHLLLGTYNQFEIKYVIGQCDFFIGSRMHSCIAALSQGIPSVGIAYSKKFIGVFESAGIAEFVLDAREMSMDDIIMKCGELYAQSGQSVPVLRQAVTGIKQRIAEVFREEFGGDGNRPGDEPRI